MKTNVCSTGCCALLVQGAELLRRGAARARRLPSVWLRLPHGGGRDSKGHAAFGTTTAERVRVKGRRIEGSGRTEYIGLIGSPPVPASSRKNVAPHIKIYNDVLWNYDRQRLERRCMETDSQRDYYKQEWFDLGTGETTWGPKEGRLSDPDMHGESARRRRQQ
jgi:hypothetical protein